MRDVFGANGARVHGYYTQVIADKRAMTVTEPITDLGPGPITWETRMAPVSDADGKSYISGPDFGVAVIDEIETPKHRRERFTVGY